MDVAETPLWQAADTAIGMWYSFQWTRPCAPMRQRRRRRRSIISVKCDAMSQKPALRSPSIIHAPFRALNWTHVACGVTTSVGCGDVGAHAFSRWSSLRRWTLLYTRVRHGPEQHDDLGSMASYAYTKRALTGGHEARTDTIMGLCFACSRIQHNVNTV